MFNNQKFLTRGIESEIPAWLVHLMWHMVLTMEIEEKDYLQVFKLTKTPVVSISSTSRSSHPTATTSMYRVTMP